MHTEAGGYVVQSNAASELLPAVRAVFADERFSWGRSPSRPPHTQTDVKEPIIAADIARHREVALYSDDLELSDDVTQFIGLRSKTGRQLSLWRPTRIGTIFSTSGLSTPFSGRQHCGWTSYVSAIRWTAT